MSKIKLVTCIILFIGLTIVKAQDSLNLEVREIYLSIEIFNR